MLTRLKKKDACAQLLLYTSKSSLSVFSLKSLSNVFI